MRRCTQSCPPSRTKGGDTQTTKRASKWTPRRSRGTTADYSIHPSSSRGTCGGVPARPRRQTKKKRKQHALCSCAQTQVEHMGCPPCMTQGADQKHRSTPEPGRGETAERRTLGHEWRGTNISEGQCAIGGMQDNFKDGKTAGHASIQKTEHNSHPSPIVCTCSGVPARRQPPEHAVFSCQNIGGPKVP